MSIEAMKQVLEALEKCYGYRNHEWMNQAITCLRQAIAEAEKQEPVAWGVHDQIALNKALETHLPKREWVGLTDAEIQTIVNMVATGTYQTSDTFARAIEKALKDKNT